VDAEAVTRLRGAIGKLSRPLNASATREGLSPTQASILGLIVSRGPLALPELVEIEGVNPTMLSRVVGKLTDLDLITRSSHPLDSRSAEVEATRAGVAKHRRIKAERATAVSRCVEKLPADQASLLEEALPALEALAAELQRAGL
jgi:DNA-binding MarR family transcriptional regulator